MPKPSDQEEPASGPTEPLVNESLKSTALDIELTKVKAELAKKEREVQGRITKEQVLREKIDELEGKVKLNGYSRESRTFRIYLEIIGAFTQRGLFDGDKLKTATAPTYIDNLMKHAAGLAEVAEKTSQGRF